jgi:hypothetical protein
VILHLFRWSNDMKAKIYIEAVVTVTGREGTRSLPLRLDLSNNSPMGLEQEKVS